MLSRKSQTIAGYFMFLCVVSGKVMAQTITSEELRQYAGKLVAAKILTPEGGVDLIKKGSSGEINVEYRSLINGNAYSSTTLSKASILQFCADAFASSMARRLKNPKKVEPNILPEDSMQIGWTVSFSSFMGKNISGKDLIPRERSVFGLTRKRTVKDFLDIGLIDEKTYQDCMHLLTHRKNVFETDLLELMTERASYRSFADFYKKEQFDYIEKLTQIGLLDRASADRVLITEKDFSLKTIPEILRYSNRYVLIDLSKEDNPPETVYRIIFDSVKRLIPSFTYSDLQATIEEKPDGNLIRQDLRLSFQSNGRRYQRDCFYNYRKHADSEPARDASPVRIGEDFQKIINLWLRDQENEFRLYSINANIRTERGGPESKNKVGLLLLKNGEAEQVSRDVMLISRENYDTFLSAGNIGRFMQDLASNGFFSHLSQAEIDSAQRQLRFNVANSLGELLIAIPRTVVCFDWETGNLENPYEALTLEFSAATRNAVSVTGIVDEYSKGWDSKKAKKVKYGFVMNGRKYETQLPFSGDWLAPEFMELFQRALDENKAGGRFHQCVFDGQVAGYIFLTDKQLEFINGKYPSLLLEEY